MEALNERIKNLRKEKGLTQGQLADMLGITDKAVSKWEVGEANPDLASLPKIAEVFGVTLDYLILGKKEEPAISLDDMDATKRAIYLTEKDDAGLFAKYVKITESMLWSEEVKRSRSYRSGNQPLEKTVRQAVFDHRSLKVFSLLLDEFLKHRESKDLYNMTSAGLVHDRIDDFVLMCAELGRIDALDDLGLKWFSVGNSNKKTARTEGQTIKPDTLEALFDAKKYPKTILEYLADFPTFYHVPRYSVADYDRDIVNGYLEPFMKLLYEHKEFELLKGIVARLDKNADAAIEKFSSHGSWPQYRYVEPTLQSNGRGYNGQDWGVTDYVPRIHLIEEAKQNLDREWLTVFNEYNKKIDAGFKTKDPIFLSEPEIERYFKLHDASLDESAKRDLTCICNRVVQLQALLATGDLKYIRSTLQNNYWCLFEFAYDASVNGKNKKELFRILVDNGFDKLAGGLMSTRSEEFLADAWHAFEMTPSNPSYDEHKTFLSRQNTTGLESPARDRFSGRVSDNPKRTEFARAHGGREFSEYARIVDGNPIIERIKELKEKTYQDYVDRLAMEKKAAEDAAREKTERAAMAKGLTKSYFEGLLAKGDQDSIDLFAMKLCALMDAIFIYDYHYAGDDFSTRMNAHFKPIEDALPQKREMDDGWGYMVEDTKYTEEVVIPEREKFEHLREIFYRLRVTRNNLLHPEKTKVKELSKNELRECLDYVFGINRKPEE